IADDAADAIAADSQLAQIILVGHVTVPYSGLTHYDTHGERAFPTDLYYADADATPGFWGDYKFNAAGGGNAPHELTTNEPGDGRFDANGIPGNQQTITITGSDGQFILA
ncbi:MAG: hypothetical protein ACREJC_08150, partial [Tepidisphaeraceae bacterium]